MPERKGREVQLAARPVGEPKPSDFAIVEKVVPAPGKGQVLVRNLFMSVDPYMRGRMNDARSYAPPWQLGAPCDGGAVGEVVEADGSDFAVGDKVLHNFGWREYVVADAAALQRVDESIAALSRYLGVLGMPGFTAWVGVVEIAKLKPGDIFFVSGAAGAVGGTAGQIARLRGASRVVGSAGSDEKVRMVTEQLGFDAAFNYRSGEINALLAQAAPDGIDVYFDNVGGEHLEAAITAMRLGGRIAMCGAISVYNATEVPPGPRNLGFFVGKRLDMRGFLVFDHSERLPEFLQEVGGWLHEGKLQAPETVVEGIENAPSAFIGMLRGENTGKMIVRLA